MYIVPEIINYQPASQEHMDKQKIYCENVIFLLNFHAIVLDRRYVSVNPAHLYVTHLCAQIHFINVNNIILDFHRNFPSE